MLEKLNFSTVDTFTSTSFEGGTGLSICFNANTMCVSLSSKPLKYIKVWSLKWHGYPDFNSLGCSNKMNVFYIVRKTMYLTHSESVKKNFKICALVTKHHIGASTRI